MDQFVLEGLLHLKLTKEEEEDIALSTRSKSNLMEECALSLFGKLLSDRQQNQKALKSTLRTAWKMGSELRIVDVVWGLPFENLSEEVGKDLGNSLGRYIETDKRSWFSEQAKFMRIRVDLPLNKPLRRGGNIVNLDGSKTWVIVKFERLPCFCFQCGLLGHDEQHCPSFPYNPDAPKQYGVWLKAGGNLKESSERSRASSNRNQNDDIRRDPNDGSGEKSVPMTARGADMESV
ncbi:hypothetical protein CFP56_033137 [Quercus suber]|uniref:CCHC-type domain-containing protein n=1 Tax=Quercus suber TaxID=58331 RepID=A0AAW0JF15_QUESU|nr:hypothetical protein CFP56_57499 [Quercus suber]